MSSLTRRIQKKGRRIGVTNPNAPAPNSAAPRGSRRGIRTKDANGNPIVRGGE